VVLDNGTCQTFDTITVRIGAQLAEIEFDSVICAAQNFSAFDSNATSYFWNTSDTTSSVSLSETGQYWVARFAGACSDTDTVNIVRQRFSFEDQMILVCDDDSASLFANAPQDWSFLWSNGDTTQQTTIYGSGDYWVRLNSGFCLFFDTLETRFVKSEDFDLGADQELCRGEAYLINLDTIDGVFLWSTGDTSRSVTLSDSGLVWVSIVNQGCELRDSINVNWRNVDTAAFATISNVITPNGDGLNDILEFNIANEELVKSYRLTVFNRWGALIFESRNQNISWDAKTSFGEKVAPGTYFYSLDCETVCVDKGIISVRETVTVLD
jgi:gliding motility-associated-like protein